jgi:hypothetical protein
VSESVEIRTMELDVPYLRAVSSLGKKSSFEKTLSCNGSVLVEKQWMEFNFDLDQMPRISTWKINGDGRFLVTSSNLSGTMAVRQKFFMDRNGVSVDSWNEVKSGYVVKHETKMKIINKRRPITVRVENYVRYERMVPRWMDKKVDEEVVKYNAKYVENLANCVKSIIIND